MFPLLHAYSSHSSFLSSRSLSTFALSSVVEYENIQESTKFASDLHSPYLACLSGHLKAHDFKSAPSMLQRKFIAHGTGKIPGKINKSAASFPCQSRVHCHAVKRPSHPRLYLHNDAKLQVSFSMHWKNVKRKSI